MKTAEIRRRFLDHFVRAGHTLVPSASLVYNDPTLLFVNAGMVPFKPYFTGAETPPFPTATSCQKCVRTLDIEEVGKTTRHGTFFQMNGNFSFGEYFKEGAIRHAWGLITGSQESGGLGFDGDKVWVTVLGPGYHPDFPDGDVEAIELWKQMGLPADRIQLRDLKDNYWNMGVPGPGGPCSEIYIDRGPAFGPEGGPAVDEDRFLEIWNLVFMQQELSAVRAKDDFDVLRPLPKPNIDTGMGLERVAYLMQGKDNLYEIDQIFPVIEKAAELSGKRYGADHDDDVRMRVVADHVRSGLMLMTDGVTPGNEARGYVLRRLLRRSVRAMRLLGVHDPVLPELLPVSKALMEESYPEIATEWARTSSSAYAEEESFRRTLAAGTQIFDVAVTQAKEAGASELGGDQAFQLHDTYGFPIDLTLEMAAEAGLAVDRAEFTRLMGEQKARAKADARAKKGGTVNTAAYRTLRDAGETPFLGYTDLDVTSRVRGIVANGQLVTNALPGDVVEVILDETPFYAEAGGQDADAGVLTAPGLQLEVLDVQRPVQGLVVHKAVVNEGELVTGAEIRAEVDPGARFGASQAHTATHVVNAALRQLLGAATHQAGSYNKPGYLRFDFNAHEALSPTMRSELEGIVNEAVRDDFGVTATEMPLAQAKALGAQAMFGEKYGDVVRMVELNGAWSRELCGGTHVRSTAQIGLVDLIGEGSVGSGIRRVEALVSTDAFTQFASERALVSTLADTLKTQPDQLVDRVERLLGQLKAAEKQIADLRQRELLGNLDALVAHAVQVGGVTFVAATLPGVSAGDVRTVAIGLRDKLAAQAAVIALVGGQAKPVLLVATTAPARERGVAAGRLVGVGAAQLGGKGGGKDDLAQGGGTDASRAEEALAAIRAALPQS
ncbi:MAG TPA: alanine--tRNA ligase [Propioniciclava sp.]|jgi:alanyl-tRNA synthetase|uniref:alanine--tRNA ligase n=1 Tax=Propioniciclava sp. TaxID=2038686 RepID=UPI002CBFD1CC|nr:alanine--tRNA ligase [Propioniciclava sp.]HRL49180.1 alanine--tRNA ligase [Propioniciclava sp.]HRL79134.1 alanine--tRNA ligase [Propioniciclava sp.]